LGPEWAGRKKKTVVIALFEVKIIILLLIS
jgi:hypothetical protein